MNLRSFIVSFTMGSGLRRNDNVIAAKAATHLARNMGGRSRANDRTGRTWLSLLLLCGSLLGVIASESLAQGGVRGRNNNNNNSSMPSACRQGSPGGPNVPYDGRFIMVRVPFFDYAFNDAWCYDWPDMERNFVLILREITRVRPRMNASQIIAFDDPEIFKYPLVYVSEPGYWTPSDTELKGLRDYMAKGGFVFFDDFFNRGRFAEWDNFEYQFRRAMPDAIFYRLDNTAPIFDRFYKITALDLPYPNCSGGCVTAEFYAVYQDNDPNKHMMAIISYNSDLGEYMQWSGTGINPINLANEAFKFAVNFVIYGMSR